jgi:threonine/homoserine/homoserine lactone efflux protein
LRLCQIPPGMLVALGVGGVIMNIPYVLTTLTLVGAGYLPWLGLNMLLKPAA